MALSSVMDLKVVVANRIFIALLSLLVVPEKLYVPVPGDGVQVEVPGADGVQGAAFTPHLRLFHSFMAIQLELIHLPSQEKHYIKKIKRVFIT